MRTPDINALVAGVLAIIGVALAIGQYDRLEAWSRKQAMEAMQWKRGLPYFFSPDERGHGRSAPTRRPRSGGAPVEKSSRR